MTHITITKVTNIYGIKCEGHAGYADAGSDIVCAGISALTEAFDMVVETYDESDEVDIKIHEVAEGYIHITYHDPKGILQPAFTMLTLGLEGIRDEFPYNINLNYKF